MLNRKNLVLLRGLTCLLSIVIYLGAVPGHASPHFHQPAFFDFEEKDNSPESEQQQTRYNGAFSLLHGDGSYAGTVTRNTAEGFDVYYTGYLNKINSPIWLWIKLNGRGKGGDFKAVKMENVAGNYYVATIYRNNPEFSDLFYYAYHGSQVNNWDIELFFVNDLNNRDENYGANFKGTLAPRF